MTLKTWNCTVAAASGVGPAPTWFVNQTVGTWATIAGSAGQRVADKLPNPVPSIGLSGEGPNGITTSWTGGAVDQARREFILCANGGHADYSGNEAYALSLGDAVPAWRRISDPTPNGTMIQNPANEGNGLWSDGRVRAMHSTFEVYGDGKVWFPLLNSVSSPGGGTINNIASFDRNSLGPATSPLAHNGGAGPWAVYGAIPGLNPTGARFGHGLFDRVNHFVYGLGGFSANSTAFWRAPTQGGSTGIGVYRETGQSIGNFNTWSVCAHDLGLLIAGDSLRQQICVLPVANFASGNWQIVTNVTGTGFYDPNEFGGGGGVYVQSNHTIGCGNPKNTARAIARLQIPLTGSAYNASGQWVWTTLNPTGSTPSVAAGNSDANSKWNIVEDMGNGQSAIVFVGDISGPTYVYKVPPAGL